MKEIKKYLHLYFIFIKQFIKRTMQSKVDFIIGIVGFLITQISGIVFIYLIFQQIPSLNDWSFNEILFIYGFSQIPRGIDHIITDNLWLLGWKYVITGNFDRYLLRPINIFFLLFCERIQVDGFGELIVGIIFVYKCSFEGVINWNFEKIVCFFISVISGAVIYTAIKLFFSSLAFWFQDSMPFLNAAYSLADFCKYPTEIYSKTVRAIITYIIPFAFVGYIPAKYFVKGGSIINSIGFEVIIAIILFIISDMFFKKGISIYESSGN